MGELRRIEQDGRSWILFDDVCQDLDIGHSALSIGRVPRENRMQSFMEVNGRRRYVWFVDDDGAHDLGAAVVTDPGRTRRKAKRARRRLADG